jgi:hypothetical protein
MTLQETFLRNVYITLIVAGVFAVIGVVMLIYGITYQSGQRCRRI